MNNVTTTVEQSEPVPTANVHSNEFRQEARNAHREIRQSLAKLKKDWVSLGRQIESFKQKRYHLGIIDKETGEPFTNFADWARSVFGKSPSTIFKELKIFKELQGTVKDDQLAAMPKENASHLADIAAAGGEVTSKMVEDAANFPNREFCEEYPSSSARESGKNCHVCKLAIDTSPETNLLWRNKVLPAGRLRNGGQKTEFGIDDLAMRDIANVYLEAIRLLPTKKPESVTGEVMDQAI